MGEKEKNYLTIAQNGDHEIVIKKSRFICSLARTKTQQEAQDFITQISKKYHDATHNTYAYTLGLNDEQVKASDNGEPSGTAGVPELQALQLMNIKNVTAVVTRYFGGTKLGAGGLIRAYSNAVTEAVEAVGVVRRCLQQEILLHISYANLDRVNHYLKENDIFIDHTDYTSEIIISIFLDLENVEDTKKELTNLLSGNIEFLDGKKRYNEVPVKSNNYHEQ